MMLTGKGDPSRGKTVRLAYNAFCRQLIALTLAFVIKFFLSVTLFGSDQARCLLVLSDLCPNWCQKVISR